MKKMFCKLTRATFLLTCLYTSALCTTQGKKDYIYIKSCNYLMASKISCVFGDNLAEYLIFKEKIRFGELKKRVWRPGKIYSYIRLDVIEDWNKVHIKPVDLFSRVFGTNKMEYISGDKHKEEITVIDQLLFDLDRGNRRSFNNCSICKKGICVDHGYMRYREKDDKYHPKSHEFCLNCVVNKIYRSDQSIFLGEDDYRDVLNYYTRPYSIHLPRGLPKLILSYLKDFKKIPYTIYPEKTPGFGRRYTIDPCLWESIEVSTRKLSPEERGECMKNKVQHALVLYRQKENYHEEDVNKKIEKAGLFFSVSVFQITNMLSVCGMAKRS